MRKQFITAIGATTLATGLFLALPGAGANAATTARQTPVAMVQVGASTDTATPFTVNNLGLNTTQAKGFQRWLRAHWGYTDAIDGQLGTDSWKAEQRHLKANWGYTGPIDGVVGSGTVSALQRFLKYNNWGYDGPIDGVVGSGTRAAFATFANWCVNNY